MKNKPLEVIVSDGQSRNKDVLEKASRYLSEIRNGYEIAVSRALNRAATAGRAAAVASIRQEYSIKASTVRRNFLIEKATRSSLEALVSAKGKRIPLVNYRVRPRADTTGNKRKRVRVAVKAKGGLKPLGQSFVYKGRVLRRLSTRSLPVQEVFGPAIPMLASNEEVSDNIRAVMQETFEDRLDHETRYLLDGGNTGRRKKRMKGR